MQDLKLDKDFNVVFNNDLDYVSEIQSQKQRLYKYFQCKKGSLFWAPSFGFDIHEFLKISKIGNKNIIKNYFENIVLDLKLNVVDIDVKFTENKINITFYFVGNETLNIDI